MSGEEVDPGGSAVIDELVQPFVSVVETRDAGGDTVEVEIEGIGTLRNHARQS